MLGPAAIIGLIAMISCVVTANLLMKLGATTPAAERMFFGIVDWKMLAGLVAFCGGAVIYAVLLETIPLNLVQSLGAAQFIAVIIVSNQVLAEPISVARWIGVGLIAVGIFVAGATAG
jgi:drug/metabolite transporter (DMT)-like permease